MTIVSCLRTTRVPIGFKPIAMRVVWGLLALIHVAPVLTTTCKLFSGEVSNSTAASCTVVWLAFAFFALKSADVSFLRWRCRRSGVLAFLLICALAHRDVRSAADSGMAAELPTAVAAALACDFIVQRRRQLPAILDRMRLAFAGIRLFFASRFAYFRQAELACGAQLQSRLILRIPRAPPC